MRLFHANIFKTYICLKHSHFLKVKVLDNVRQTQLQTLDTGGGPGHTEYAPLGRIIQPERIFDYERSNRNNFNIRYWSWNYRGCWHQTCPPIDTRKGI